MKRFLFVCSRNRLRSPTAEQIFADHPGLETLSAGLDNDADHQLTGEDIVWADAIFVMEKAHRTKLRRGFARYLDGKRVICLDIRDEFRFMDPALIALLRSRMAPHLP